MEIASSSTGLYLFARLQRKIPSRQSIFLNMDYTRRECTHAQPVFEVLAAEEVKRLGFRVRQQRL